MPSACHCIKNNEKLKRAFMHNTRMKRKTEDSDIDFRVLQFKIETEKEKTIHPVVNKVRQARSLLMGKKKNAE
jgi:hypothetical protein